MSNTTILQLPVTIAVTGAEWMEVVQGGVSVRITLFQLAQYVRSTAMTAPAVNIYAGQQVVSATAAPLPNNTLINGVWIKAAQTNTGAVFVGQSNVNVATNGTGTGFRLDQGEKQFFPVVNANLIYIIGTAADVVFFEGN